MHRQNIKRDLLKIALLIGVIFAAGAESQSSAQDRTGVILSGGGRSGYLNASGGTDGGGGMGTGTLSASGGVILSGGGRTEGTSTTESIDEEGSGGVLELILGLFI